MAAGDEQDLIEAVVTCEGNLHDPDFQDKFRTLVTNLKSALYISKTKDPFRVRKIEPWNSVRVTISIPKEAAQKLKLLAQQGSNVLRSMGILSVQVEGDQVISLTWAAQNNEPTQVLIRQTNDETASTSSGTSGVSSSSLPASSPSVSSISSSVASISSPIHTPGSSGEASGIAVTLDNMLSSSSSTLAFRSPNVVAPSGEAIPVLPPKTTPTGVRPALGGPFPFVSMAHAAQAIQRNELSPVLSCNNVVVSNSNISGSNAANSTNSIASSIPSSSIFQGAIKSVQPPQMHLPSTAISNNPNHPSSSGSPVIVSTAGCNVVTTVNVNSESSHVTRLIIENPLNSTTQMVGGNVASLGISSNNVVASSQAGPSQSLQLQLVNVPPPYPGVNTISSNHSLNSSSSNPSGILTSNVQVRHSQQQASLMSNVSGSSSSIPNLPTIRMVTSTPESHHTLLERRGGGLINNEMPSLAPIANISDSTSDISSLAQPVSSPLLVNLLQNNDAPSGSSSSTTSANTDAYNQQLMQKNSNVPSRAVTASSDNPQGRYLIQQQQLKKTKRGLSMDGACSSVPKPVPVSGSDILLPTTVPQAPGGADSFQFALPLPSDNTSTVTMNRVSIPVAPQSKMGGPQSNQKGPEQNRRTIMQGNYRIVDQGSAQLRAISRQQQQHPPPPPYSTSSQAQATAVLPGGANTPRPQFSLGPEQVTTATLTNGPLHLTSELGDGTDAGKSHTTTTPITLVHPDEHQAMDRDASKTTLAASLVADQSRTLLPITTVNIVSKSSSKPSSTVNFNSSKDSDSKTFIPPPDPRISSQVQKMSYDGNNPVTVKNSASSLVVQTSYNTDAKSSTSQLNSAGRAIMANKRSKERVFPITQIPPTGKPRQFLINPLTGHLEPMPCESSSESEEGSEDGGGERGEGGLKSNSHKSSSLKNKPGRGPPLLAGIHHRQIVTTESGVTVARVVKGPVLHEPSTAQSHREFDGRKPTNHSGDSSMTPPGSVMSVTKKSREDSVTNVALYNQKDVKESNSPATVTATSVSGEKIKLRLKLEKSEPISPAYKVDVSFVKKSEKSSILPNVSSGPSGSGTSSASTFSSSSGNQSSSGDQPRVPPLHISLRGKNAAVVVSPRREEKDNMPPPPTTISGNTKDLLVNVITKDATASETHSTTSASSSHSKSTSHTLNSHEGKSSKSSGIMKRAKGRVKSLDSTSGTSKGLTVEKTKTKSSRPKLSKELSRQDMLAKAESQEGAKDSPIQFPMPVLHPQPAVVASVMTSTKETQIFEKPVLSDPVGNKNALPVPEIISINNNNKSLEDELSAAAELPIETCATSTMSSISSSTPALDLIAEQEGTVESKEETAKINSAIENVIFSRSKEKVEEEAKAPPAFPVSSMSDPSTPPPTIAQTELVKNSSHSVTEECQLPTIDDTLKGAFSSSEIPPPDLDLALTDEVGEEKLPLDPVECVVPPAVIPSTELNSNLKIEDSKDPVINLSVDSCDNNTGLEDPNENPEEDTRIENSIVTEEVGAISSKGTTSTGATKLDKDEHMEETEISTEQSNTSGETAIQDITTAASSTEAAEESTAERTELSTDVGSDERSTPKNSAQIKELSESGVNIEEGLPGTEMEVDVIQAENMPVTEPSDTDPLKNCATYSENLATACETQSNANSAPDPNNMSDALSNLPSNEDERPTNVINSHAQQSVPEQLLESNDEKHANEGMDITDQDKMPEGEIEAEVADISSTINDHKVEGTSGQGNADVPTVPALESESSSISEVGITVQDSTVAPNVETSEIQEPDKIKDTQSDDLSKSTSQEMVEITVEATTESNLVSHETDTESVKADETVPSDPAEIVQPSVSAISAEEPAESLTSSKSVAPDASSDSECGNGEGFCVDPANVILEKETDVDIPSHSTNKDEEVLDKPVSNEKEEKLSKHGSIDGDKNVLLEEAPVMSPTQLEEVGDKTSTEVAKSTVEDTEDTQPTTVPPVIESKEHKEEEKVEVSEMSQEQEVENAASKDSNTETLEAEEVVCSPKHPMPSPEIETEMTDVPPPPSSESTSEPTDKEQPAELPVSRRSSVGVETKSNLSTTKTDMEQEEYQPLSENDNNLDAEMVEAEHPTVKIPEEITTAKELEPTESNSELANFDELNDEEPPTPEVPAGELSSTIPPALSVPNFNDTTIEKLSQSSDSEKSESFGEDSSPDDDTTVNVTIMTPKTPDVHAATATNSPPISIVLPSNPDGKGGTSKNSYKRRAEIKPGALQNTLKRLHDNFFPKVLKTSDNQDVTSQRAEEMDDEVEPSMPAVEPVKATLHNATTIPITTNKAAATSHTTVTPSQPVSIAVSQVRPMASVIHRPQVTKIPISTATVQPTLHQISSGLHQNLLANVSVGITSSTLTSVTSISVPSTSSGSGTQTVFAIHPNVSIPANFAQLQQSPVVLPGGHKMVPIKLVTLPKQSGGQLQTIPLGSGTPNRSSPNLLEAVNIVANAGSRSSSPKTTFNAMQSTPLNLSSMSLPVGSNLHFVPISVSSGTGTTGNVKVLMTQPIKMQQAGLSQSMVVKSMLMGNQSTTIRVIRPSNLQEHMSIQSLMKPAAPGQATVNDISKSKPSITTPAETLVFKRDFVVQPESLFKKLDGVEIVETGSPLNNDELPFEADIIHDEKDLADVLASEAKSEMIPMENCADFSISLSKDASKTADSGIKTKVNATSVSANKSSSIPNHVTSKSLLQVSREVKPVQGVPVTAAKRASPVFTYSSSSKSSRSRSSPSPRSPSPLTQGVQDLHGEDQEIINSFSGTPSLSRSATQSKSQTRDSVEGKLVTSSDLLPDHTYGITSSVSMTNCGSSSNSIDEVLSIEIPPMDIEVAATLSPSQNVPEEKRCTRSTRSNTRLSPDITAFVSDTPKPSKLSAKVDPLILKNSPKPSPTGSLKVLSPTPSSLTITPSTSTRSSPILNSQHQVNAGNAAATINAVALGIIDKIQGNATAQNAKNSRISKLTGANKRKRQESDSSSASRDENNEEKAEIDLNSRPGKRKCSENAAEMIKVCIGVEDSPKRYSASKKTEEAKSKESKGKKGMGTVVEEDDDADSEVSLTRGRSRSSRESSEDRSSSRGSSVQRVVSSTSADKPKTGKEEDQSKDTKSSRLNSRLNKDGAPKLKTQPDKSSSNQSSPAPKKVKESGKVVTRRPNRPNSKNKSPLTPAKTRTNVRKDALTSNANSDKGATTATPPSNTNPESENARRKTRSSAAGKRHTT